MAPATAADLLALPVEDRTAALVAALRGWAAAALAVPAAALDPDRPLAALGLDSLAAVELAHEVEQQLGVAIPLTRLLDDATLHSLAAQLLEDLARRDEPEAPITHVPPAAGQADAPLSHGQQALWFLQRLAPHSAAYTIAAAVRVHGAFDAAALGRALAAVVDRHAALRTTFHDRAGLPVQRVHAALPPGFQVEDAAGLDGRQLAARLGRQVVEPPFDMAAGPLLRAAVLRIAPGEHALALAVHHLVADFGSLAVLFDELGRLYARETGGAAELAAPPDLTYADWVAWQRRRLAGPWGERQWEYWRQALTPLPPDLELPTDRPRPAVLTDRGDAVALRLGAGAAAAVRGLAAASSATLFATLLAGFQAVLGRFSGQDDVAVGCPVGGRRGAPGLARVVGYFVNPVVVRADLSRAPTFGELLHRVRSAALGALEHAGYPFALLTERLQPARSTSRSPVFQALFVLQRAPRAEQADLAPLALGEEGVDAALGPLAISSLALPGRPAQFDLALSLAEAGGAVGAGGAGGLGALGGVGAAGDDIALSLGFNADLFDRSTATRLAAAFRQLLVAAAADPGAAVGDLPLLAAAERFQLLAEWNASAADYPAHQTIDQLIAARAEQTPDRVAVEADDGALTCGELAARSLQLARHLRRLGVRAEVPVGVLAGRSCDMVVALLGVLQAGGAYVPLDPTYPAARLDLMLEDSGAPVVLTQQHLRSTLADLPGREVVCLDADWPRIAASAPDAPFTSRARPDQTAYLIYTSGSTGRPKGVEVSHRSLVNFLASMARQPGIDALDRLVSVTTLSFDIAGLEIYLPLAAGARLILASRQTASDGAALLGLLERAGVTVMQATPATWRLLLAAGWEGRPPLRVLCGGEALPRDLADRLAARGAAVWNLYGPTETTIWSAVARVAGSGAGGLANAADPVGAAGGSMLAIGRPIANTSLHVVDSRLHPAPIGVPGELLIGGHGVARGYRGRPDLTAERFIPDPWSEDAGARLYRTGDLTRRRGDGEIEFLGRLDHQVKIRGVRVELGEVEAAVAACAGVGQAVVAAQTDSSGLQRLVAYVVAAAGAAAPDPAALRREAAARLPEAYVPSLFQVLDRLPLTPNGKVDRRALPAAVPAVAAAAGGGAPPRSALERTVAGIWRDVLGLDRVGLHDNFFDLGGHSLLAAQVHARLREALQIELSLVDLFRHPTVAALAQALAPLAGGALSADGPGEAGDLAPGPSPPLAGGAAPGDAGTQVAIVGMAGRFPGAPSVADLWRRLRGGEECLTRLSAADLAAGGVSAAAAAAPGYVPVAGLVAEADCFDAAFFALNPREAELMDPQHRVFLECAWHALEDAGYDPRQYGGRIGLYAGAGINTYLHHAGVERVAALGGRHQAFIANDKDFVTTRASYKLDLRGPSINVQTACSTSLVAVHLACQALRAGDCDMALAGGVAIRSPQNVGYRWEEGGISSPDGHCRAFDAHAQGTVFGNGVGLLVLKPLARALADGDTVHAVIKGTAINNDGALKVGYTAPGVAGQAQVIAAALAAAGVDAGSVSFVEAHGTGTPMGDPIEVAALTQVFQAATARRGFCALGSVKTNLGHLDTAAGVAGMVKAVLALEHREIPPSLHFATANPRLDLAAGPFFVNTALLPWEAAADGAPRRAGVSSFGIGGTNAHVVLEEAPPPAAPTPVPAAAEGIATAGFAAAATAAEEAGPRAELLLLSARSAAARDQVSRRLAAALAERPDLALADVAHTLRVGRRAFAWRRMLVAADAADLGAAAAALAAHDPERVLSATVDEGAAPEVALLFSGQGSQHPGMARRLYAHQPVFRRALDECCELLRPHLHLDLRQLLFPAAGDQAAAAAALQETRLAQPALFAVEHSLARLWQAWGVHPAALLGHSVGEYVAACLAQVFSLPQALALVAARGRLMQAMPAGAMLGVQLSEADLLPLLGGELSLAAVNGPAATVVSGPGAAVAELERRLAARRVRHRRLHTSHAFHSAMMEPILDAFAAEVARCAPRPPRLRWISNLTGTWIDAGQAADPAYWARHLRGTVRFAAGLRELCADPGRILLEVGPGNVLATLARQNLAAGDRRQVLTTLPHPQEPRPDDQVALQALGRLWLAGVAIDAEALAAPARAAGTPPRRVPLPLYPFERQRYWLEAQPAGAALAGAAAAPADALARRDDPADWTWAPLWRQTVQPPPLPAAAVAPGAAVAAATAVAAAGVPAAAAIAGGAGAAASGTSTAAVAGGAAVSELWLLLAPAAGPGVELVAGLVAALTARAYRVVLAQDIPPGTRSGADSEDADADAPLVRLAPGHYRCDLARAQDVVRLIETLRAGGDAAPIRVLHLLNVGAAPGARDAASLLAGLPAARRAAFDSPLAVARALEIARAASDARFILVASHLHRLPGDAASCPERALLLGLSAVIPQEIEGLACRVVDLAPAPGDEVAGSGAPGATLTDANGAAAAELAEDLLAEAGAWGGEAEPVVAWRDGVRWVRTFGPAPIGGAVDAAAGGTLPRVRDGGIYLITGGLGGIGLALAGELAAMARVKLALLGRGALPPREQWEAAAAAGDARVLGVLALEAAGAEVATVAADVADRGSLAAALVQVEGRLGGLVSGVIHAAGVPGGRLLQLESDAGAAAVLAPKVAGTLNLAALLDSRKLDFFVLCSSLNATLGGFGQASYAAANAFLDGFAAERARRRGTRWVAMGWDRWEAVGMAARSASPVALWQGGGSGRDGGAGDGAAPGADVVDPAGRADPADRADRFEGTNSAEGADRADRAAGAGGADAGAGRHPLLDAQVERTGEREVWLSELSAERHWVLAEHLILGRPTVPGTTYLEMARAAFAPRAGGGAVEIRDVVFPLPLAVSARERREVRTILDDVGDGCEFRVVSRPAGASWQEHARGRLAVSAEPAPPPRDVAALRSACTRGEITQLAKEGGFLRTGRRWQCLRRVLLGVDESVAELVVDQDLEGELGVFGLHPAVLDAAAGAVQVLGEGDYLPLAYERLTIHAAMTRRSYSHLRLRGAPGDVLTCDIQLLDPSGRVLVDVAGFSMRRVRAAAAAPLAHVEAGGIRPQEGAALLRRVLAAGGGVPPQLIVSTRALPAVLDAARAFGRQRLAERLDGAPPAAVHERPAVATAYAPPADDLERRVAAVWERVLGIDQVGVHDNFFELGGTSLTGIQLVADLKQQLGVEVPTVAIFQAPTVAALVRYLRPAPLAQSPFAAGRARAEMKKQVFARARRAGAGSARKGT